MSYIFRVFFPQRRGLHELSQEAVNSVRDHLERFSNRFERNQTLNGPNSTMEVQHFGPDNQCPICLNEPQNPVWIGKFKKNLITLTFQGLSRFS